MTLEQRIAAFISAVGADIKSIFNSKMNVAGGVFTGLVELQASQFAGPTGKRGGMDANNSDIVGLNCLYWADATNTDAEGIKFPKANSANLDLPDVWDTFRAFNGTLLWSGVGGMAFAIPVLTLTQLLFDKDSVSGTVLAPITGNLTASFTGANVGSVVLVIHNSATVPSFDASFKKLSGSGNYQANVLNYIYCHYIGNSTVLYAINQTV